MTSPTLFVGEEGQKIGQFHLKRLYPGGVIVGCVLVNQITLIRLTELTLKLQLNELMTEVITGSLGYCWERLGFCTKTTRAAKCQPIT